MKLLEKKRKPAFKVKSAEIKEKAKGFVEDKKNANNFIDVLSIASDASFSEDPAVLLACTSGILKIITFCIDQEVLELDNDPGKGVSVEKQDPESKYNVWVKERAEDGMKLLLSWVENGEEKNVRETALVAFMKIIAANGRREKKKRKEQNQSKPFSKHLISEKSINALTKTLLSSHKDMSTNILRFQEYTDKLDVVHCLLMYLNNEIKSKTGPKSDIYWNNFFSLLQLIKLHGSGEELDDLWLISLIEKQDLNSESDSEMNAVEKTAFPEDRKLFSTLWTEFLESPLPSPVFKKSLVLLADHVMPFMTSPLALTDFLIKSYDMGGIVSILALNGIFILIHRYNLEYPNFYTKLYSLLKDANIFQAKYRARFFFLVDLFLTSSHIPAYLVCAFVKRLGRLALVAPPTGIIVILNLIRNLFIKHPNAQLLVHCNSPQHGASTGLDDDPFCDSESDPAFCKAMESSLWEVSSLTNHYYPPVSKLAKMLISQPIAGLEKELGEFLEQTEDDIFERETNGKLRHVPVNHVKVDAMIRQTLNG